MRIASNIPMKYNPEEDGITHINIYSKGATKLGQLLSNFAATAFVTEQDGGFKSVEGYWYWLFTHNLKLRRLHGYAAKKLGKELVINEGTDRVVDEEFINKIKGAFRAKLRHNPHIRHLIEESSLPFTHYLIFGGNIVEKSQHNWQVEYWEILRDELKEQPFTLK